MVIYLTAPLHLKKNTYATDLPRRFHIFTISKFRLDQVVRFLYQSFRKRFDIEFEKEISSDETRDKKKRRIEINSKININ